MRVRLRWRGTNRIVRIVEFVIGTQRRRCWCYRRCQFCCWCRLRYLTVITTSASRWSRRSFLRLSDRHRLSPLLHFTVVYGDAASAASLRWPIQLQVAMMLLAGGKNGPDASRFWTSPFTLTIYARTYSELLGNEKRYRISNALTKMFHHIRCKLYSNCSVLEFASFE